jgi:predicted alpha-1,2-mannosidase
MLRSSIYVIMIGLFASACSSAPSDYVRPFVGTDFNGHTFPGATLPFGMVQLSPDTRIDGSWEGCSGYHYSDSIIYGFSHTHLSGTGVSDYGDIMMMPQTGVSTFEQSLYASAFRHEDESAEAGYYRVLLQNGIEVELTATQRVGVHRYHFPAGSASVILDLNHRDHLVEGNIIVRDDQTLLVARRSSAWARDQHTYASVMTSSAFRAEYNPDSTKVILHFDHLSGPLVLKVGISFTDVEGAMHNLEQEMPDWDMEAVRHAATLTWDEALGKIEVRDDDEEKMCTFYTALYHTMMHPNIATDVDGRYRGMDQKVHTAEGFEYYTVYSLWDTFRALHPLFSLIERDRTTDFIQTFLTMYQQGGRLPVWELCSNETDCMIGYHSVSVMADAMAKGISGFDQALALEAAQRSATWDHLGLPAYERQGYLSVNDEHESVSKTLEYAYDDWCIAQMAFRLGEMDVYDAYIQRSNAWRNLLDPSSKLMRPRKNGGWLENFDPREVNNHFTEGNSWQYSFFVPHDVEGMIEAMGGRDAFRQQLDALFSAEAATTGRTQADITGLIGQYAHGNEPSHHMAYLYNYIDRPDQTRARVHQILNDFYTAAPDGLIGNEDCGQMSAWYVMSSLGIYAVNPGEAKYALVHPFLEHYTVHLENGHSFSNEIIENELQNSLFIDHSKLTGEPVPEPVPYRAVDYLAAPIIQASERSFDVQMTLHFDAPDCGTVHGTLVDPQSRQSQAFTGDSLVIKQSSLVECWIEKDGVSSASTTGRF